MAAIPITTKPTVVVIVPTWNRIADLPRCLGALANQSSPPDRVILAGKESDKELRESFGRLASYAGDIRVDLVLAPRDANVVQQQNAALDQTTEAIVALTDDDAEPASDWLERMLTHFESATVGGVGGRDWQPIERGNKSHVGMLSWYGRITGNHHLGFGPARPVHILKGVNCSFRGPVLRKIRFDERMRGTGTVINWELAVSFAFLREGYQLIYDPAVSVKHHISDRKDGDTNQRGIFETASYYDNTFNEVLAILGHLSAGRRLAYRLWIELVGTIGNPGLFQVLRTLLYSRVPRSLAFCRYNVARRARHDAIKESRRLASR
jgi:glycosyltransferase involved in cell wall biosynthesis